MGISQRKYNAMRAEQLKADDDGIDLMPFTDQPVMPEWDETLALPPTFEEYLDKQDGQATSKDAEKAKTKDTKSDKDSN
jgi:general secretion pathway protein D